MIRFNVLGPLTVHCDNQPVTVNAAMLRGLMTLLLHRPGQAVSMPSIVDVLWHGQPPATARKTVQVYIGRLRKALDDQERIRRIQGGYAVVVGPDELDTMRFRSLIEAGRDARRRGEDTEAERLLSDALGLWRGTPFADLEGADVVAAETRVLEEQWLAAHEMRTAILLDLQRHREVIADLAGLLTTHLYQERLASFLMLALYRSDRHVEALDLYRRIRDQLDEELGVEPGPTMSWLQQAILRTDSRLQHISAADLDRPDASPAAAAQPPGRFAAPTATQATPALLPPDVYGFTGRATELAWLDAAAAAAAAADRQPTAVVISAVSGTAGAGKTTLAVHWAHRVRNRFPDGQLYVNLRGFDRSGSVMDPAEAIRRFLDALGVPAQRIPADPGAQADMYRTMLIGKSILVVLDNARDADQVRPLLPGAPGCFVIITSRNRLTSLIAAEGAHALPIDLLTHDESHALLRRRLGSDRVAAEPEAVDELITLCSRLPLALAIVAANAITHPQMPLATLAGQIRDSRPRLAALTTGDADLTDMRAVFSWSYEALSTDSARLFRLLGLHPGPDISAAAAASLAATPADQARSLLDELANAHLVTEYVLGRYTCHDLLHAYAADLAYTTDSNEQRHAASGRILDHYLHTAHTAARLLDPDRESITLAPPQSGTTSERLVSRTQALGWFTAEHLVLVAAVKHAAASQFDAHTWKLAWALYDFLHWSAQWHDFAATWRVALVAADRLADPPTQARAHTTLAYAYTQLGRLDDAQIHLLQALDLDRQGDDLAAQADTHYALGRVSDRRGRHDEALQHTQRALELFKAAGHRRGQARALNAVGWHHAMLGDHQLALTLCQQALTLFQDLNDRHGQAATWDSCGYVHHQRGHHEDAITCYQHALDLVRGETRDRSNEADFLTHLGDTHHACGNRDSARTAWQQALNIYDQLQHPGADKIRAKLDDLNQTPEKQEVHQRQ